MVYSNQKGFIEHSSFTSLYTLGIQDKEHSLQFCDFLNICSKLKSIDLEAILSDTNDKDDYTTFNFLKSEKTITLNIHELIVLKDLVDGILFELYLEDILYRAGIRVMEEEFQF